MILWQVWLISISSILLAFSILTLMVYLALVLRSLRNIITGFQEISGDFKPIGDFLGGVKTGKKQEQQSFTREALTHSRSFEIGRLATECALNGLALWKTLRVKVRKS